MNVRKTIHSDDPAIVIVVCLESLRSKTEVQLFDIGVDDVVTAHSTTGAVVKRILLHLERRYVLPISGKQAFIGNIFVDLEQLEVWNNGKVRKAYKRAGELADVLY